MALTPEDVVNKRFQHVKFRDGYDQDEVDDFLDEVVVELRRLYQENDELRQKLSAAEQRVNELSQGGSAQSSSSSADARSEPAVDPQATQAMPAAVPGNEPKASDDRRESAEQTPASPLVAPQQSGPSAGAGFAAGTGAGAVAGSAAKSSSDQDAHGLIALAQRLHDEHLAEGERTRDKLIGDAEKKAQEIVRDAEKKRDDTLRHLETEKANLEREIDGLQNFERQYRTRLKSYLNDQLRELENSGSLAPETLGGNKMGSNPQHSI